MMDRLRRHPRYEVLVAVVSDDFRASVLLLV
jgi:hypothetical protein